MNNAALPRELILSLFEQGLLDELLVLGAAGPSAMLGHLVREKGKLVLKDSGFLKGKTTPPQVAPCWDIGIMGALCDQPGREWESLTFVGSDYCISNEDLTSSRMGMMKAAKNQYNDNLLDFCGSFYRGFQLMLDNHFLPVVLPHEIKLKDGNAGLAVSNLRVAGISIETLGAVHEHLRKVIEPRLSLAVEDVFLDTGQFTSLFPNYQDEES